MSLQTTTILTEDQINQAVSEFLDRNGVDTQTGELDIKFTKGRKTKAGASGGLTAVVTISPLTTVKHDVGGHTGDLQVDQETVVDEAVEAVEVEAEPEAVAVETPVSAPEAVAETGSSLFGGHQ